MTIDVTDAESRLNWHPVYKVSPADNFRDFARRLGIEECPMNKRADELNGANGNLGAGANSNLGANLGLRRACHLRMSSITTSK